jgi:hypothetical protein
MLTGSAAVQGVLAATERAMLGEGDTVLDAIAVAYDRADLRVSLTGEGDSKAAIAEALHGQLMAFGGGFSQGRYNTYHCRVLLGELLIPLAFVSTRIAGGR